MEGLLPRTGRLVVCVRTYSGQELAGGIPRAVTRHPTGSLSRPLPLRSRVVARPISPQLSDAVEVARGASPWNYRWDILSLEPRRGGSGAGLPQSARATAAPPGLLIHLLVTC